MSGSPITWQDLLDQVPSEITWDNLDGELIGWFGYDSPIERFVDGDIGPDLRRIVYRLVWDLRDSGKSSRSSFLNSMVRAYEERGSLTAAQCRGVLNVVAGNIDAKRHYYQSRFTRQDGQDSEVPCLACGAPLDDDLAIKRGLGPTCYLTALGVR